MKVKEILLLHHSHLDIGYTHTQPILQRLQKYFIDEAFHLFEQTAHWAEASRPRWTVEVTWQLEQWMQHATAKDWEQLQAYVKEGRLGFGALQMNITPLGSPEEMIRGLSQLERYRELTGDAIRVAFQHDITGVSWALSDLLIDSGVDLLVMGINLHTGNDGPGDRPNQFLWETPSGRRLRVMNGHHYSSFDQILQTAERSLDLMESSFAAYERDVLQPRGYAQDFLYMTLTNVPVMYDNGQPNLISSQLIEQWNREGRQPAIRFVTPDQLRERLLEVPEEQLETYRGDWSDFWNHGATSTAWETALNSKARSRLKMAEMLELLKPADAQCREVIGDSWEQIKLYDEHTWTSADADPHLDESRIQSNVKSGRAVQAHELATFALQMGMEALSENPSSFHDVEGVMVVNASPQTITQRCYLPAAWLHRDIWGRVMLFRSFFIEMCLGKRIPADADQQFVDVTIPPYSWQKIPFTKFQEHQPFTELKEVSFEERLLVQDLDNNMPEERTKGLRGLESPYHQLCYDVRSGRIARLTDKRTGWDALPEDADYDFFELVHEEPDARFDSSRKSFYDRDTTGEMRFKTCWNEKWRASRTGATLTSLEVLHEKNSLCLKRSFTLKGMDRVEHFIRLFADRPTIEVQVDFYRQSNVEPEAVYLVTQLNLNEGWQAHYDTAGVPVELDAEQLDGCSHGWVTCGTYAAMHGSKGGALLFNNEAPLAQLGDFNWTNTSNTIARQKHPLLLAWPLDNYWETNFPVTQPGKISLRFGFQTVGAFNPAYAARQAAGFSQGLQLHPLAECPDAAVGTLVSCDNPQVLVEYVRRSSDVEEAVLLRLINLSDQTQSATVNWPMFTVFSLEEVTPQERPVRSLDPVSAHQFEIQLTPNKVTTVRVRCDALS